MYYEVKIPKNWTILSSLVEIRPVVTEEMLFDVLFLFLALGPLCAAEQKELGNFGRGPPKDNPIKTG